MKKKQQMMLVLVLLGVGGPAEAETSAPTSTVNAFQEARAIFEQYGLPCDLAAARQATLRALVTLIDPRGRWLDDEEMAALQDEESGFAHEPGVRIRSANGVVKVTAVVESSPAAQVGLQAGDVLESVEGEPVAGLRDWQIRARLLTAPGGTRRIVFRRGMETQTVEVATARIRQPAIVSAEDLPGGLGYLRVLGLYEGSGQELIPALRAWDSEAYCGIVLDLRGANGMDLEAVADVASLFADEGALLFSVRDTRDQDIAVFRARSGSRMTTPVMALIDEETTGAAEALAAVLSGSVRGAMLLGSETKGNPGVRQAVALPGGGHLYLATRRLVLADGRKYDGREGVAPDVRVTASDDAHFEYEPASDEGKPATPEDREKRQLRDRVRGDPALRRAVDILLALKALNIHGTGRPADPSR